jgi:transcriptional regulator with GAF, ATPase, and Fis domain
MTGSSTEPRLVAVTGVMAGEIFSLNAAEVTFGRDAANDICVPDAALSRRHCVFSRHDRGWIVHDLESSNGTFVNGIQVNSTRPLAEGDRITAGGSVFLFVATATAARPHGVDLVEAEEVAPTSRLAVDDTAYLKRAPAGAQASRVEHGLRALLTISTAINALRREEELHEELLRLLHEFVPAAGIAIVLTRRDGELEVVQAGSAAGEDVQVSRAVVKRVLQTREGILTQDMTASRSFRLDGALPPEARSLLCVPLAIRDSAAGAIYIVAAERAAFDDDHLQLVTAVARIAATALENVRHATALQRETERLQADLQLDHNLVGDSEPMRRVYERLGRVARAETTALITGETGTGKELAARAIHLNSGRARRPFVAINCAALAETLLETELFGHERGAFTGAVTQKKGKLEVADGGTLFLDEIGELALPLQGKLLRVLQQREFERVGGTRPIKVDIRLVSATNRSLADEAHAGRFREDLYFRLNVVTIDMPPLRERRTDIPALANYFLNRFAPKAGRRVIGLSREALNCLKEYDWPGNVRELENAIERAVVLGSTEEILPEDLPESIVEAAVAPSASEHHGYHAAVRETKKRVIVDAFRTAGNSYTEAARLLGVHPNYLHRLIRTLGLKPVLSGKS